ncbi:MAG: DNA methyltransferase [Bryobacteraceae bacterium]
MRTKNGSYPASAPEKAARLKEDAPQSAARPSSLVDTRVIYCGDNLEQLQKLPDACIDLIYIDPPFNSNRNYEVFWGETKEKRAFEDRHENTKAYIDYMRPRCEQMARVLKKTGSFYYHCDWHASHYVKVMLDGIFGENNFLNEIIWRRNKAKGLATRALAMNHDTVFVYTGGDTHTFNAQYLPPDEHYLAQYKLTEPETGRKYQLTSLLNPAKDRPNLTYEFLGVTRVWRWTKDRMQEAYQKGLVVQSSSGAVPRFKRYLDEQEGVPVDSIWNDIGPISGQSEESLGYPTQKPAALLERIIKMSSNENDVVLDAFCGCGTALVAAQKLKRQWIGIDISPTACRVMAKRLKDKRVCGFPEDEDLWAIGRGFVVRDLPWTEEKLRAIPPFEFENWAVIALGGRKNKTQVGDKGIDGRIFPVSALDNVREAGADELALEERFYPMQVKQKDKTGRPDIDAFETAMRRAKCEKGFFVSFDYSSDALHEIDRFFREEHRIIIPLTVRDILDQEIARKLA